MAMPSIITKASQVGNLSLGKESHRGSLKETCRRLHIETPPLSPSTPPILSVPLQSPNSFALKLCQTLRKYPMLVFKANTKGSFLSYIDQSAAPLR
jgi:hypothetical protein